MHHIFWGLPVCMGVYGDGIICKYDMKTSNCTEESTGYTNLHQYQ